MPQITQDEFLAILFADCGYDTSAQRRGWLQLRFGKQYSDELTKAEKSRAIDLLKLEKSNDAAL